MGIRQGQREGPLCLRFAEMLCIKGLIESGSLALSGFRQAMNLLAASKGAIVSIIKSLGSKRTSKAFNCRYEG